jgi:hypothetical protein
MKEVLEPEMQSSTKPMFDSLASQFIRVINPNWALIADIAKVMDEGDPCHPILALRSTALVRTQLQGVTVMESGKPLNISDVQIRIV